MPGRPPARSRCGSARSSAHFRNEIGRGRGERGAVLVEFAFAFPVLLLVVVFALSLLWAAFVQAAAGHAAREGARYASVVKRPDAAAVVERVRDRVGVLRLADEDVTVEYPGCPTSCSNGPVVVTVRKTLPGPLRPFARVFTGGDTIVARSEGKVRAE